MKHTCQNAFMQQCSGKEHCRCRWSGTND
jgi:hypothetical protein